jgi:hypothetical protein
MEKEAENKGKGTKRREMLRKEMKGEKRWERREKVEKREVKSGKGGRE